jgi:fatty acid/phospholipid biosynthesis enzyme
VFLGLNGIVIKSHGGADPEGFAAAIDLGYDMVRYELLAKIGRALVEIQRGAAEAKAASAACVSAPEGIVPDASASPISTTQAIGGAAS